MKALVIDDHPIFVSALISILQGMPQPIQARSAPSITEALTQVEANPDLSFILLDLGLPGLDGLSFLRILEKRRLTIPVIVVSSQEEPDSVRACVDAGTIGFIPKSHSPEQVRRAIEQMLRGEIYLPPQALPAHNGRPSCPVQHAALPTFLPRLIEPSAEHEAKALPGHRRIHLLARRQLVLGPLPHQLTLERGELARPGRGPVDGLLCGQVSAPGDGWRLH